MNKLIPKYSFIKLCIPSMYNYNYYLSEYTNMNYIVFEELILINNIKINTMLKYNYNFNYNYNIITSVQFNINNQLINEQIIINNNLSNYKLTYKLNDNVIIIPNSTNNVHILDNYQFINDQYLKYYEHFYLK